jgi:putative endopeptidase
MQLNRFLLSSAALAALSCSVLQAADTPPVDPGFSVAKMDRSVVPGEDFAKFAAGGWYASTKIPADKSRWGGFDELAERNWSHVRAIVQAATENPGAPGSLTQKVGDFLRPRSIRSGAISSASSRFNRCWTVSRP